MSCVRGAIAGVIALLLSSCATLGEPIAEPSASTPASPSPSPSEAPPSPSPSASTGWELVRFDHPDGVYSFEYPKGWLVDVHRTSEPPAGLTVQNFPEKAAATSFAPSEIKIDVDLTLYDDPKPSDTAVAAGGVRGQFALQANEDLDPGWEGSGVVMTGGAIFELRGSIGRFDGIGFQMLSGTDSDSVRELFLSMIRSLRVPA